MGRYADPKTISGKYSTNAAAAAGRFAEGVQNAGDDWATGFGPWSSRQNSCGRAARQNSSGLPALLSYAQCMNSGRKS